MNNRIESANPDSEIQWFNETRVIRYKVEDEIEKEYILSCLKHELYTISNPIRSELGSRIVPEDAKEKLTHFKMVYDFIFNLLKEKEEVISDEIKPLAEELLERGESPAFISESIEGAWNHVIHTIYVAQKKYQETK